MVVNDLDDGGGAGGSVAPGVGVDGRGGFCTGWCPGIEEER